MCDIFGCGDQHKDMPPIEVTDKERRDFLKGLTVLPLATVLFYPELAKAAAGDLTEVKLKTKGGKDVVGFAAIPEKTPAPVVLLIHEWWGLNDQIKAVASEMAREGFIALAVDLFGGKVAKEPKDAMAQVQGLDKAVGTDIMVSWIDWARKHEKGNGSVATMGWCFGGGWSLDASIAAPVDATVVYYGNVAKKAAQLKSLSGPVMGHFGTLDKRINKAMVEDFEKEMEAAGKAGAMVVNWYEADHAFANPSGARYDAGDAELSFERTLAFLQDNLFKEVAPPEGEDEEPGLRGSGDDGDAPGNAPEEAPGAEPPAPSGGGGNLPKTN